MIGCGGEHKYIQISLACKSILIGWLVESFSQLE